MQSTSLMDLTAVEAIALAYARFRQNQFTSNNLALYLGAIFSTGFKVSHLRHVDDLLVQAFDCGLVSKTTQPKGLPEFRLTQLGMEIIEEVELPQDRLEKREKLDAVKQSPAERNAAPVIIKVNQLVDSRDYRALKFIKGVWTQWVEKGWVSPAQVEALVTIAGKYGEYVDGRGLAGVAEESWRAHYIELARQQKAADRKRKLDFEAEQARQYHERRRVEAECKEANRKIKAVLDEMDAAGKLADVENVVEIIFPEVKLTRSAKASVFGGAGSAAFRVCIAAIVFGKAPNEVWRQHGSISQPTADSDLWVKVTQHPSYVEARGARESNA